MNCLNTFSEITAEIISAAAQKFGTPLYLYDEKLIVERCRNLLNMPNAFGIDVRYAMKANSTKAILQTIYKQGLKIDASSINEAVRAHMAGVNYSDIILTTQEVPQNSERKLLEDMMLQGLKYNICSLLQLELIADFAALNNIKLSMRVHPGIGAGESATRNTGDNYSCFGVHLSDIGKAIEFANSKGIIFNQMHVHIGSGGDPEIWRENITHELNILEQYFPDADTVSFGGGLKEARMPKDIAADILDLGTYAKNKIEEFYNKTGRKLKMEIEPGTYVVANSGYIITQVIDKKKTGDSGLNFVVLNGGMEVNTRPLLYGSQHPFYVVSENGNLLSSDFNNIHSNNLYEAAIVGRCCESGDSQSLDENGLNVPRTIAVPEINDYLVIGGSGAYCSSMAPFNYNSHFQAPEVLITTSGEIKEIRKQQTLEQIIANEL